VRLRCVHKAGPDDRLPVGPGRGEPERAGDIGALWASAGKARAYARAAAGASGGNHRLALLIVLLTVSSFRRGECKKKVAKREDSGDLRKSALAQRLDAALPKQHKKVAEAIGISSERLTAYRCGSRRPRNPELIGHIADAAGVNVRWLLTGEGPMRGEAEADDEAIQTSSLRVRLFEPGFREMAREEITEANREKAVPIVGRIAAGEGVSTDEADQFAPGEADAYVIFEGAPPRAFAVRIVGDSMDPPYEAGDLVIADGARPVERGLAAVAFEQDGVRLARLKQLHLEGGEAILLSMNPAYGPVRLPRKALVGAWQIIEHLPRVVEGARGGGEV